jgi:hypothetical protein
MPCSEQLDCGAVLASYGDVIKAAYAAGAAGLPPGEVVRKLQDLGILDGGGALSEKLRGVLQKVIGDRALAEIADEDFIKVGTP